LTAIGQVSINVIGPVIDGQSLELRASISGDAAAPRFAWSAPVGSRLTPPAAGGGTWQIPVFTAAADAGVFSLQVTDSAASDSPKSGSLNVQPGRTISRFGRLFTWSPHQGVPGGVWLLAGPGVGPDGIGVPAAHAPLDPASPIFTQAGQVIYLKPDGHAALAKADDFATAVAIGVVVNGSRPGQITSYTSDGTVSRADWTPITGTANLIPGRRYFLSPSNIGRLVDQPPVRPHYICSIGRATSSTTLEVEIQPAVKA
jgi:hypothetical protein